MTSCFTALSRHQGLRPVAACGLLLLVACGVESAADLAATVRDSAGITIVENRAPGVEPVWRVAPEPAVDIGVFEGDSQYQLYRVVDAAVLGDGRLAIANSGTAEVRVYDRDGAFVRGFGREGEGPGEFRQMAALWTFAGDSLMVSDIRLRRMAVFDTAGRFARTITFAGASETVFSQGAGVFPDGSLLMVHPMLAGFAPGSGGPKEGARRDSSTLVHYGADGERLDSLGMFPDFERYLVVDLPRIMMRALPFGRYGTRTVCGGGFYYGAGDRYELEYRAPDGTLRRIVRRAYDAVPVTADAVRRYKENQLAEVEDEARRQEVARLLEEMPYPATMPPHDGIQCDREHRLWVRDYQPPWAEGPARWSVFDPDGRLLGAVETPPGLRVVDIGPDYVLGIWRDDLEIEHVRRHRLLKEAAE